MTAVEAADVTGAAATGVGACAAAAPAGEGACVAAADGSPTVRHGAVSVTDGSGIAAGDGSGAAGSGTMRHGGVGATAWSGDDG